MDPLSTIDSRRLGGRRGTCGAKRVGDMARLTSRHISVPSRAAVAACRRDRRGGIVRRRTGA
jgi:hypothetical protein